MKIILQNLKKVLTKKSSLIVTLISTLSISFLFYIFTESDLIIWNLGFSFFITVMVLNILVAILFWLFVWSTFYKIIYFSNTNKKNIWVGWVASFFGILVSWCPACSITLASYIGLASFVSVLPYSWLELKIASFVMLLYVVYDTLKKLEVCSIKNKKSIKT